MRGCAAWDGGTEMPEHSYSDETDRAWAQFRSDLTRYLRQMEDHDTLVLSSHYDVREHPSDDPARVRLSARPGSIFRCEVPANRFLPPQRALQYADHERLFQLGFEEPDQCEHEEPTAGHHGSDAYYLDIGPAEISHLATAAVVVFRDIWGLPAPSFLRGKAAGRSDVPEFDAWAPEIEEDAPESSLQILVEATLVKAYGGPLSVDHEGVITLTYRDSHVHVRPLCDDGYIDIYAGILPVFESDCEEEYDFTREVLTAIPHLNVQWPSVKWHLAEDALLGIVRVDAEPFMPNHLIRALNSLHALLDSADDILTEIASDAEADGNPGGAALLDYKRPPGSRNALEFPPAIGEYTDSGVDSLAGDDLAGDDADEANPDKATIAAETVVAVLRLNTGATRDLSDDEIAELCENDVDLVMDCLQIARAAKSESGQTRSESEPGPREDADQQDWALVIDKLLGAIASLSRSGPNRH